MFAVRNLNLLHKICRGAGMLPPHLYKCGGQRELSLCWQNSKAIGFEYVFSQMRIFCGKFLKRLGWANWICSCVISAIVENIAGLRFVLDG